MEKIITIKDLFITDKFADIVVTEGTKKTNVHAVFLPDYDIKFFKGEIHSHSDLDYNTFEDNTWRVIYNWLDSKVEALQY